MLLFLIEEANVITVVLKLVVVVAALSSSSFLPFFLSLWCSLVSAFCLILLTDVPIVDLQQTQIQTTFKCFAWQIMDECENFGSKNVFSLPFVAVQD